MSSLANVLLVDDRETDILLTQIALQDEADMKCNLLIARDSNEALVLLQGMIQKGETIDLMLLDINMPGMDGFELLEHLRNDERTKHICVIMCTGSTYNKDMQRAQSLGSIGYIVKPVCFDKLKPVIEQSTTTQLLQHEGNGYSLLRIE